ncbi:MAG: TetR/AcrR family transcriptional regulator [Desulfosporosinus sp.]|nr:TetR/AcrR family transcriptional regulator [Desulfosporosinus sp.]
MNPETETSYPRSERRDASENRQRILKAAQKLFDKNGVEQVSMNQIASEAQVGSATLYRRYSNKSELCQDLIKDNVVTIFMDIDNYLEQNHTVPPSQRLRGLLSLFINFREKKIPLLAGIEESSPSNSFRSRLSSTPFNELRQYLVRLFDEINEAEQAHFNSVFRADILIIALSSDSYLFQREVRGYSPENILELICGMFISH